MNDGISNENLQLLCYALLRISFLARKVMMLKVAITYRSLSVI